MLSTSLRRVLVASGLVIASSFAAASGAFALTTGDVNLSGTVNSTLAISSSNPNTAIDLAASQTDTTVKAADLAFGTNNSAGLTVASSGTLTLSNGQATPVPFTVGIVAGSTGTPAAYYPTNTANIFDTSAAAAPTTAHALYIKYSTAAFQDPGNYTATVTLTVSDN
jgi:hypothetical protein